MRIQHTWYLGLHLFNASCWTDDTCNLNFMWHTICNRTSKHNISLRHDTTTLYSTALAPHTAKQIVLQQTQKK